MKFEMSKDSLFAVLLRSQWWISFLIAAGLFAAARLWLPGSYAFFVALPFLVIAVYALWKQARAPGAARIASTAEAVRAMPWEEFSGLVEEAFRREGYAVSRIDSGPADFGLTRAGRVSLAGCRRWKAARTGIEPLRELHAERIAREAHECIHVATGEITENARAFAAANNFRLIHGTELAKLLPRVARAKKRTG